MRLKTLGGLTLEPATMRRPKPLLLLAYLALEGAKEKRHLYELFWPDSDDSSTNLRMTLSRLREAGTELFSSDERTVSTQLQSDIADLQAALEQRDTQKLLELYQGAFLAGFSLPDWGAELEEWVYSTREFVASQVRGAFLRQGEQEASQGNFAEATVWAERAYRVATPEPEDLERLYGLLLVGESTLSLEVRKHAKEYSLELVQTVAEARARFYSPSTDTTKPIPATSYSLPTPKTSFVGRDPELLELSSVFEDQGRLLTLLGPGGIGKTRLATQFAQLQLTEGRFADGVFFVELDRLSDPEQIPAAIAEVLGVGLQAKQEPLRSIAAHIGQRQILLVLDNFEHLMDGALWVSRLLELCPNLKILSTSRERLNLEEEFVLPLRGLHVPQAKKLELSEAEYNDAIRLFVQRAKRARLEFELTPQNLPEVLQICQIVEGSPLGIELATVWLRALSPKEIVEEILHNLGRLESPSRNIPERHHSLQAVFEHSWQLLSPKEQAVLSKLTVFIGGFTREAAGAVTDATIPVLTSLVDKSMLRQSEGRYDFHALLYQFAREKLPESSYDSVARQHICYFLSLAENASPQLYSPEKALWLRRLAQEHDNFRAALQWAMQHDSQLGLSLAAALKNFWLIQGHLQEGLGWLERFLSLNALTEPAPAMVRANALTGAAWLAHAEDNFAKADQFFEESAVLRRSLGQNDGLAAKRVNEAMQARSDGDYGRAVAILEEALTQHRQESNRQSIGDDGIGLSLSRLALIRCEQGRYAESTALWEECLTLHQTLGDRGGIATALLGLSDVAREQANTQRVRSLAEESLALFRALGEQWGVGFALNNLAIGHYLEGDLARAAECSQESVQLLRTIWGGAPVAEVLSTLGLVLLAQGEAQKAQAALAESLEKVWAYGPRWLVAVCLEGLAGLELQASKPEQATKLLAVAATWREKISIPLSPLRQSLQRSWLEATQTLLSKKWESVWQVGLALPLEEGIALALQNRSDYPKTPSPKIDDAG